MSELDDARLAVATALSKRIKPVLEGLKAENAASMAEAYAESHVTQRALLVGGQKVGTTTWVPGKTSIAMNFVDTDEALADLAAHGLAVLQPVRGWQEALVAAEDGTVVWAETGEVAPWAHVEEKAGYAQVRGCDFDDVVEALKRLPGGSDLIGLLEGGDEA